VVHTGGLAPIKKAVQITGLSPNIVFSLHRNTIDNLERGVLERVFFVKRGGDFVRPYSPESTRHFNRTLKKQRVFMTTTSVKTTPVSWHEFAMMYEGRKREMNMRAANSLLLLPPRKRDANVACFGKADKTNLTAKPDPVQRIISPTDRRYLVALGRWLKPLEKPLLAQIDKMYNSKTIMKGMNVIEMGSEFKRKWYRFTEPVAIGLDASRFDQHVSVDALKWEHNIYRSFFSRDQDLDELDMLLRWQLQVRGFGRTKDGYLKYRIDGTRTSGCINTSMGNVLLMASMVHAFIRAYSLDVEVANNGDDSVIIMERRTFEKMDFGNLVHDFFEKLGFDMKIEEPVYVFEQIKFCQLQPVMVDDIPTMVREAPVSFAKDCISIKPLDNEGLVKKWLYTVGMGGMTLSEGVPLSQAFYQCFIRSSELMKESRKKRRGKTSKFLSDPCMETGFYYLQKGLHYNGVRCPSGRTRVSYWKAFGITPEVQRHIEQYYDSATIRRDKVIHDRPVLSFAATLGTS
jgi:hypothetical protein